MNRGICSITAWTIGMLLLFLSASQVFAELVVPNSSPQHKTGKYEYSDEDRPDVWFFPKDQARWDGYKVTDWDWMGLTDLQKDMFISEGIAEIERTKKAAVKVENRRRLLNSINAAANIMIERLPDIKKPMIGILLDNLKETGSIKRNEIK